VAALGPAASKAPTPEALYHLAVANYKRGKLDSALVACRAAFETKEKADKAMSITKLKLELRAELDPFNAPPQGPTTPEDIVKSTSYDRLYFLMGKLLAAKGDVDEADRYFAIFTRLRPDQPEGHVQRAAAMEKGNHWLEAYKTYTLALRSFESLCNASGGCRAYFGQHRSAAEAVSHVESLCRLAGSSPAPAQQAMCEALEKLKKMA